MGLHKPWGELLVLGPTRDYYESLLCDFRDTPAPSSLADLARGVFGGGAAILEKAVRWVTETLDPATETLSDDAVTSAENNSSVILLLTVNGREILLTADAGIPALTRAADLALEGGIDLSRSVLALLQVPHHGSRRNVGPTILNRLRAENAVISAAPAGGPKHPAKKVVNALIRRGARVHATRGQSLRYFHDAPPRPGWLHAAPPLDFSTLVED